MSVPEPETEDPKVDPDEIPPSGIPENPPTDEPETRPVDADRGIEEAEQIPPAAL